MWCRNEVWESDQVQSEYCEVMFWLKEIVRVIDSACDWQMIASGVASHVLADSGDSYLIQTSIDSGGGQITHTIRASPITVSTSYSVLNFKFEWNFPFFLWINQTFGNSASDFKIQML